MPNCPPDDLIVWIASLASHNVYYSCHDVISKIDRLPEKQRDEAMERFHAIHEKRQAKRRAQIRAANSLLLILNS